MQHGAPVPPQCQALLAHLYPWIKEHYCCSYHGLLTFNLWQMGCLQNGMAAAEALPSNLRLKQLAVEAEETFQRMQGGYEGPEWHLFVTFLAQLLIQCMEGTANDCAAPDYEPFDPDPQPESHLKTSEQFRFRSLAELLDTNPGAEREAENERDASERDASD
jgi:hypothetical protein